MWIQVANLESENRAHKWGDALSANELPNKQGDVFATCASCTWKVPMFRERRTKWRVAKIPRNLYEEKGFFVRTRVASGNFYGNNNTFPEIFPRGNLLEFLRLSMRSGKNRWSSLKITNENLNSELKMLKFG